MSVRRFGPTLGAGVQVSEREPEQQINPAPTGVTVMVGKFEKGTPGEPGFPSGSRSYQRRYGDGRLPDSEAPQSALDFYRLGRGSGELIPWRVTAGDEKQAELEVYDRSGNQVPHSTWKAKNGGKWGGQRRTYVDEHSGVGDLTATTLDTGDTMIEDEWAGGTLDLKKVTAKTYRIVGNTAAGVIQVEADQDLVTDFGAGAGTPANRYVLSKQNLDYLYEDKHLALRFKDGQENPGSEWGVEIYVDGVRVLDYLNLSSDPASARYFVNVINDDPSNYEVSVVDDFVGDKTVASARPANYYAASAALTATVLTLPDPEMTVNSVGGADPVLTAFAYGASQVRATLTGTVGNSGADMTWTVDGDVGPAAFSVVQAGFTGVATDLGPELGTVTITNGGTPLADGDTVVLEVLPLVPDEAIGGRVWPDIVNEPDLSFPIIDNTASTVVVRTGLDLTNDGGISAGALFKLEYQEELAQGHEGSPLSDSDYEAAYDVNLSSLNKLFGKNKGLVKIATPGITSTSVTKAGIEYAAAKNYQYLVEIPSNIIVEEAAISHINSTIGRSDYAFTYFPSVGSIQDPDTVQGSDVAALKQVSLAGMILGRHALVAQQYNGYHKAPAGVDVTLPDVLQLPTGDPETAQVLNEEQLNPQGLNVIKFRQGNVIIWGDRTLSPTSAWKWLHQRSLMSHYEQLLRENFDWIIFALNNRDTQERLRTTLRAFFLPEFIKGALRGDDFEGDAFQLKMDEENNTDLTRSMGDLNAEITLRLADTVERLKINIGKAGIFDSVE